VKARLSLLAAAIPDGTADAAAELVRTIAGATQVLAGPAVGLMIGAVSEAAIAGIASHAVVDALGDDTPPERRKEAARLLVARALHHALAFVVSAVVAVDASR
jgi:hypothetical protein